VSSYYGQPVIAEPVWKPEIPAYFFVGGIAGATAPLTLAAGLRGNDVLARRAAAIALAGSLISPALLIMDLGRPARFLNMLRLFKRTSPMSVGSWVLTGFGATATASAGRELLGVFPAAGRAAQVAGAGLGPLLATYTATLIANTAIPVWHDARRELPFVFGSGAVGTAGALAVLVTPRDAAAPARRMLLGGALVELAAVEVMERHLGDLAEPYHGGRLGRLARGAKALTGIGAAAALGRRPRIGALAVLGGGLLERWVIFRAGFASARDPRYTVEPQRARSAG
jgi:formate-dependent nitrite reductase membrane component NrfD